MHIPKNENLVTYFVLPLLRLNKTTFARSFRNSYINTEGTLVYVELSSPMTSSIYKISDYYRSEHDIEGSIIIVFAVPEHKMLDVSLFLQGLYSKMSKESKKEIYAGSSLPYNDKMEDFSMSHPILHGLASTKKLRNWLFTYLDVRELADTGELLASPEPWWFIEHRINELKKITV